MSTEVVTGLFTGLGALIGFLGTALTAWIATRSQREQRREAKSEKNLEIRRDAYAAALAAIVTYMAVAWQLNEQLSEESSEQDAIRASFVEYCGGWRGVVEAVSKVEIIGPKEISEAATSFRMSVNMYRYGLDLRYSKYFAGAPTVVLGRLEESLLDSYGVYSTERAKFVELARKYSAPAAT